MSRNRWRQPSQKFYGNGTVFVVGEKRIQICEECNYDMDRFDVDSGIECWICEGLVVCAQGWPRDVVIDGLKRVIARLQRGEGLEYLDSD
jgi:hypothetical protein